ncbi:MAG: hypothetical protein GY696_17280 [Gammaproteobacteria bacterium]|nr:hypothetical protein [Gammaproteobacteria bacterium]
MRQAYFAFFPKPQFLHWLLFFALLSFSSLLQAGSESSVKPVTVPNPANDLWRAIREGQAGFVANPANNPAQLIVGIPRDECSKSGNCTEQLVGFALPIHALVPGISEKRGVAGTTESIGFILILFAGLMIGGLLFVVKLSRERPGSTTTKEGRSE